MSSPADLLAERAAALLRSLAALPGPEVGSALHASLATVPDSTLLQLLRCVGEVTRLGDAVGARVAGEVERRSRRELAEPLAKRLGEKNAATLVALEAGVSPARAKEWCGAGEKLAPALSLVGELLPTAHPVVDAAVDSGELRLDEAQVLLQMLHGIEPFVPAADLPQLEQFLVGRARALPLQDLAVLCRALRDRLDPDGVEPREDELIARAGMKEVRGRGGLPRWIIDPDPESAGFIRAALEARMSPRRPVRFVEDGHQSPEDDPALEDTRSVDRRRLDGLVDVLRDGLTADAGTLGGAAVTMLVVVDHAALTTGVGTATVFGVDEPISARTARRLACEAQIIPVVLGGDSQPLDVGSARRLFSPSQRYAMAVRDGGCVWPGCNAPPSRCEAAHLEPWHHGGRTDLRNGVLLCRFHHRRFDNDGWSISGTGVHRALIPPPWVDASRRPRPIPPLRRTG